MPTTKSISQLETKAQLDTTDLFETAAADSGSASGYTSRKESAAVIAEGMIDGFTYPTAMPNMQSKTVAGALNALLGNFAPVYDATSTYVEGDLCTYNGVLYVANTDISTPEAWTAAHWTQTTAAASGGGGSGTHNYSTTARKVGKWIDGKDIWEKTYIFDSTDIQNGTLSSSVQKGQFWLDHITYDMLWLDYGNSFWMNTNYSTSAPKSCALNYFSASSAYTRTNIQRSDANNDGYPFIYFENSYSASTFINIINDFRWLFTVRWTEATTP